MKVSDNFFIAESLNRLSRPSPYCSALTQFSVTKSASSTITKRSADSDLSPISSHSFFACCELTTFLLRAENQTRNDSRRKGT